MHVTQALHIGALVAARERLQVSEVAMDDLQGGLYHKLDNTFWGAVHKCHSGQRQREQAMVVSYHSRTGRCFLVILALRPVGLEKLFSIDRASFVLERLQPVAHAFPAEGVAELAG